MNARDMTVGHPARERLLAWASEHNVAFAANWFLYLLQVRDKRHWDYIATALDGLAACDSQLQRWVRRGVLDIDEVAVLANAWSTSRPPDFRFTRATSHPPTQEFSERGIASRDYLYLLMQCQPPTGLDVEPMLAMRAWVLMKATAFARRGNVSDELLRQVCHSLRLAAYEKAPDWAVAFRPTAIHTANSYLLEARIGDPSYADDLAQRLGKKEKIDPKHHQLLATLKSLATGSDRPDAPSNEPGASTAWPAPAFVKAARVSRPAPALGDHISEGDLRVHPETASESPEDGPDDQVTVLAIGQDPDDSPAEQADATRTIHLLHNADARFLVWDWNRPTPAERLALDHRIAETTSSRSSTQDHLIAALTAIALSTGQSLAEVMRIPTRHDPSSIWRIDLAGGQLYQRAPRREGHWRPSIGSALPLRPWTEEIGFVLPAGVAAALRDAPTSSSATLIDDLWPRGADSCASAVNAWLKSHPATSRLSTGSLAMDLGVRLYLSSGDPVLARLGSARSFAGLPAATAYATYSIADLTSHHPASVAPTDGGLNGAGSLMDAPDDDHLRQAFRRLDNQLRIAAEDDDTIQWHNLLALFWDAKLRAATGARPIGTMWTRIEEIDWQRAFCFVDDKHSSHMATGRLIPLPVQLVEDLRRSYVDDHLTRLSSELGEHLETTPQSPTLLFQIERANGRLRAVPISHAHRERLGLESPLPTNAMRHRLRTWLHRRGADPEVVDSLMGHHDGATATHGDYTMRRWLDDATAIRPLLEESLEQLQISPPPAGRLRPPAAVPVGSDARLLERLASTLDFSDPDSTKHSRTKRVWQADAVAMIVAYLSDCLGDAFRPVKGPHSLIEQLAALNERQMDALAQRLCRTAKGLPSTAGVTRFAVLQTLADRSWRHWRQPFNLTRRYVLDAPEPSIVTPLACSASSLRATLTNALDKAFEAEPHLSKVSDKTALLLALLDLVVMTGVTQERALQALVGTRAQWRLVSLLDAPYLEWSPQTSFADSPEAPFVRFRITRRSAVLLAGLRKKVDRTPDLDATSLPARDRICEILGLQPGAPTTAWLPRICAVVRQDNAVLLPGTVAAFLDGRVATASLDHSDWVRLRTGRRVAAPWHQIGVPSDLTLYEGEINPVRPDSQSRDALTVKDFQRLAADDFLQMVRKKATIDRAVSQGRRDSKVDELEVAIDDATEKYGTHLSEAIRMLGLWVVHLLRQKRANGYARILAETAVHYLDSLSLPFRQLAYDQDLSVLEGDEIGELYAKLLKSAPPKSRRYKYDRLRGFQVFVENAFAVEECDWSVVAPGERSLLGAPGLIDDETYLDALALCASTPAVEGMTPWQSQVFLIIARRFGLRGREVLGLRVEDLRGWPEAPVIAVQRRIGARLKTSAAKRVVPLLFPLSDIERAAIERLLAQHESASVGIDNLPLLGDPNDPSRPLDLAIVRAHMNRILRAASGRTGLTVHDLRHSFANALWAATEGFQFLPAWLDDRLAINAASIRQTLLGRDIDVPSRRGMWAISRALGHARPSAAIRSYIHLIPEIAESIAFIGDGVEPRWSAKWSDAIDRIDEMAESRPMPELAVGGLRSLTPRLALEAMKLIPSRGARGAEAAMDLPFGSLDLLMRLSRGIESKVESQFRKLETIIVAPAKKKRGASRSKPTTSKGPEVAAVPTKRQARASSSGLLSLVRRSAFQRLRTGLQTFGGQVVSSLQGHQRMESASLISSVGPNSEISVWLPWQIQLVSALLEVAVSDSKRVALRAPLAHHAWAAEVASKLPWNLPVRASSQLPAVILGANEGSQFMRTAILIEDGGKELAKDGPTGFAFNRSEFIIALTCVTSCTPLSA